MVQSIVNICCSGDGGGPSCHAPIPTVACPPSPQPRGPRGPVVAAMSAAPAPTVLPGGNGGTALAPTLAAPAGDLVPPPALVDRMVAAGAAKAALPADKVVVLGILAGVYIGLGALLALSVGGNAPALAASNPGLQKFLFGAIGLPMGLLLVITTGAELFTGNTAIVTMAYLRKKASLVRALPVAAAER